jgi:hypothetical protein
MSGNQWTLAGISLVLALVVVLVSRLGRRTIVLVIASTLGVFLGLGLLMGVGTSSVMCDFSELPAGGDSCSGLYVADHRLPQFMQGQHDQAWLTAIFVVAGVLVVDLIAVGLMWAWGRVRGTARFTPSVSPADGG